MIFKKKPKVTFWTNVEGLDKLTRPEKANKFIPQWFKKIKQDNNSSSSNIKLCTGLLNYFQQGFIVPLWCDLEIGLDDLGTVTWRSPSSSFTFSFHSDWQYKNYIPEHERDNIVAVVKPHCPYFAETPKGWSLMQIPMYYEFQQGWTTMAGVFPSFIYPELNQQIIIYRDFFKDVPRVDGMRTRIIPLGTPLVHLVPVPNTFNSEVLEETEALRKKRLTASTMISQRFIKRYNGMIKCPYAKKTFFT
jgi:hypothetical protein